MNANEKSQLRELLIYVKRGVVSTPDALNDIVKIVDEYSSRTRKERNRRSRNKNILKGVK